jgi:4-aminobutyrate aminotransferase
VVPDITLTAKAIASGFPMSATVGKAALMDPDVDSRAWVPGSHGSTFGGNPVICAAAIATLRLLEQQYVKNANDIGNFLKRELNAMMQHHSIIGEVRGLGLMLGMEIVKDKKTREFFPSQVTKEGKNIKEVITGECFKRGLILYGAGISSLRMSPPLMITKDEADAAVKILDEVIGRIEEQMK